MKDQIWDDFDNGKPAPMVGHRRQGISWELQTWDTDLLLDMERFTHGEGRDLIRRELANRCADRNGSWVGYEEARKQWLVD